MDRLKFDGMDCLSVLRRCTDHLGRVVPALKALEGYRGFDFRRDVLAGMTVATVAVPQAMAYALVAGLPPEHGLYTAIVMTAVGALFDSSRQLINGPTNAISIALLSALAAVTDPALRVQAAIQFALMVGGLQLAVTLLRLGDLTRYISQSVILGFTAGAGALLVLDQTKHMLGLRAMGDAHDHVLVRFWLTFTAGGDINFCALLIGMASVGLLALLRIAKRRLRCPLLPDMLITVCLLSGLAALLGPELLGIAVLGDIPARLPTFELPHVDVQFLRDSASGAFAVALLGLLEAIAMAKGIAARTGQKLDLNQQCLSEGLANFTGSFFQCIPGSGSLTRSAINQQAGAVSQWSGVFSAVAVAGIMLMFAPYARFIPKALLAGLLLVSAFHMVDFRALRKHWRATRYDAAIIGVTASAAVFVSIEFCVLIGVFMSFLLTVPRAGRMLLTEFTVTPDGGIHERLPDDQPCGCLMIFGLEGELFFGATAALETHFNEIESRLAPQTRVLIIRMKRVRNPDAVGLDLLESFVARVRARCVRVVLCGVRGDLYEAMHRSGLLANFAHEEVFREHAVRQTSTLLAVRYAQAEFVSTCPRCGRNSISADTQRLFFAV